MTATVDPRVQSAHALLTGRKLLAGHGNGLLRLPAVARLLGVPLSSRGQLLAWIEARGLWFVPPTSGPLSENPQAGTIDCDALREALKRQLKKGPMPFLCTLNDDL
jgi:hypothetical protein